MLVEALEKLKKVGLLNPGIYEDPSLLVDKTENSVFDQSPSLTVGKAKSSEWEWERQINDTPGGEKVERYYPGEKPSKHQKSSHHRRKSGKGSKNFRHRSVNNGGLRDSIMLTACFSIAIVAICVL